ncbi:MULTISPECIES: hypothetical protein [Streptomyces rochei group]|uniref:hypothetical protein n=1 Tax=Streptomyces rochei group TaxID=2867164 RepID=UPI00187540CE|nr:hypothetical protein [Streptomyces vinaceusdrappus]GHC27029.1 hypothetical protein GCM10010308_49930 [Streptomyces vinaceusdrappus]
MTGRTTQGSPDATTAPGRPRARTALLNNPYGLSLREVRTEIRRCLADGWQLWEIRYRFANDRKDTTAQ